MRRFLLHPAHLLGCIVLGFTAIALFFGHTLPAAPQVAHVVDAGNGQQHIRLAELRGVCEITLVDVSAERPTDTRLDWSPDGRYLVVQSHMDQSAQAVLTVMDADTRRVVCSVPMQVNRLWYTDWKQDNSGFLLVNQQTNNNWIYAVITLSPCTFRIFDQKVAALYRTNAHWTEDGLAVYLIDRRVRTVDPLTGDSVDLTGWLQSDLYWSEDSTHLLQIFNPSTCEDGESPHATTYKLENGALIEQATIALTDAFPRARHYDWSPDYRHILAFGWREHRGQLCFIDAATLHAECFWPQHPPTMYSWSWSPDGEQLAYVTGQIPAADTDIAVFDLRTGASSVITDTPDIDEHMPVWLPGGRYLRVQARPIGDTSGVQHVIDTETGRVVFSLDSRVYAWRPVASAP